MKPSVTDGATGSTWINGSPDDNHWVTDIDESEDGRLMLLIDHHTISDLEPSAHVLWLSPNGSTVAWESDDCDEEDWMPLPHAFHETEDLWAFGYCPATGLVSPMPWPIDNSAEGLTCAPLETTTTTFDSRIGRNDAHIGLVNREQLNF